MTNNHFGPEKNRLSTEYETQMGNEVGLTIPQGIIQGVLHQEDNLYLYLLPNIAYHPIPLNPEKTIGNPIWDNETPKKIPKNLISLTHTYQKGYLADFVNRTRAIENTIIEQMNQKPKEKLSLIKKLKSAYSILKS